MAAQQPDWLVLSQSIAGAAAEIALIPNMPPIAIHDQLNQVMQQLGGIQQQLNSIQAEQDLLPMRFTNLSSALDASLQYPPNVRLPLPVGAPRSKQELFSLTGAECRLVAEALNLPVLPEDATAQQRQRQLIDYLGCGNQ